MTPTHDHAVPGTEHSLTERYVHAATRRLPDNQREDVALELRASIEDRVEARLAADPTLTPEAAEREALVELGDPDRLAAGYTGALQHLVGPELYPTYVRTLRQVLVAVVPMVTAIVTVVDAFGDTPPGALVGHAVWFAITLGIQVCFWTTVGFAVAERAGDPKRVTESLGLPEWTPDRLPQPPTRPRAALGEAITNIVWLGILAGLLVTQHVVPFVRDGDERIPVLDPSLWSFWLPLVLVALALEALFEVVKYRAGGTWTPRFAALNTVTGAVFAAPLAWLAYDQRLLNPDLVDLAQRGWAHFDPGVVHTIVLVSAVVVWLWDTVDGWTKAVRWTS